MDMLLDFVGEIIFGIAQEALGAIFVGRNRARRLEKIHQRRTERIPANFATFKRISESK
jgi:hypothetical protein